MHAEYDYGVAAIVETEAVVAPMQVDAFKKAIAKFVIVIPQFLT